jgi:hypothetical protein
MEVDAEMLTPSAKRKDSFEIKQNIRNIVKIGIIGEIIVLLMMLIISNIVFGTSWNTPLYSRRYLTIGVWIPSSSASAIIESAVKYVVNNKKTFGLNYNFEIVYSQDRSLYDFVQDVNHGQYYGALAVNEGASAQLIPYLDGSSSIKPSCSYYYDQARAGPTFQISIGSLGKAIMAYADGIITQELLQDASSGSPTYTISPVTRAIQSVDLDTITLHEVDRYGLFVVSGSGSLQMYLVMLCHSIGLAPITAGLQGHGIKRMHLVQFSLLHRLLGALYLSIFPMIVTLILGSGNERIVHSSATFFITWACTWLTFCIFGGIVYHLINIFGLGVATVISIIFLNFMQATSAANVPLGASPIFFRSGYAFPFYNVSIGFKYIWFESLPNLFSQAIGVLFIWWFQMLLAVQLESVNAVHKLKIYWIKFSHLYQDEHNAKYLEREESRKEQRLSSKRAEMENRPHQRHQAMNDAESAKSSGLEVHRHLSDVDHNEVAIDMLEKVDKHESDEQLDTVAGDDNSSKLDNPTTDVEEAIVSDTFGHSNPQAKKYAPLSSTNAEDEPVDKEVPAAQAVVETVVTDDENIDHDQTSILDPSIRPLLKDYWYKTLGFEIALTLIFIVLMFFTYGSAWNPPDYHHNIHIALLNENKPNDLSDPYTIAFNQALAIPGLTSDYRFTYHLQNASETNIDVLRRRVDDQIYFAAFVLNANATKELNHRLSTSSDYAGPAALSFIFNGARGGSYINGILRVWASGMQNYINGAVSEMLVSAATGSSTGLAGYDITALTSPAKLEYDNLHPFPKNAPGSDAAINAAATAMYLGMIAQCIIVVKSHEPLTKTHLGYAFRVLLKGIHLLIGSFVLAFAPAISMLWYGFHMPARQFFQFWAILWIGMCSFGSYMIINYHVFGFGLGSVFNILIFALNTSSNTASFPLELLPNFFRIGYGLPAAQFVIGSRYILFGSDKPGFDRAIGVLLAWIFGTTFLSLTLLYRKKRIDEARESILRASKRIGPSLRRAFSLQVVHDDSDIEQKAPKQGFPERDSPTRISNYENYHLNDEFAEVRNANSNDKL